MKWNSDVEFIGNNIRKVSIRDQYGLLSYEDVINGWATDTDFIEYFSSLLIASPYDAYFWETPPINTANLSRGFEFVEVKSDLLGQMSVDIKTFKEYFLQTDEMVTSFKNLGGDAQLIVPCPSDHGTHYPHLATFMQSAPDVQIELFWNKVAECVKQQLCEHDMWISTAGSGIAWLHLRLDSSPKYYTYEPYKR